MHQGSRLTGTCLATVLLLACGAGAAAAASPRLVAVVAHPDDETFMAGSLALAARAGWDVLVVYTTSGDAGVDKRRRTLTRRAAGLVARLSNPRGLPQTREREARAAVAALGIERPPLFLRFRDSVVTDRIFALADRLEELFRGLHPEVVVTFGPQGITGHRDHLAAAGAVRIACSRLAQRPRLLEVVSSPGRAQRWARQWRFKTVDPAAIRHRVDVTSVLEARAAAYRSYRTQFGPGQQRQAAAEILPGDPVEEFLEERWDGGEPLPFWPGPEAP